MRVELNITLRCQLACPGCDRLCGMVPPDPVDETTVGKVSAFLREAKDRRIRIDRVKVLGGEPLLNKNLSPIIQTLIDDGIKADIVGSVKVDSNGLAGLPPDFPTHPQLRVGGRKPKKKVHLPYLHAPCDLGLEWKGPCSHPYRCGFSFDARGWLPCSPAIMIDRLFYNGKHYQEMIPMVPWGIADLCSLCCYASPETWRTANARPLNQFTPEMKMPTKSWAEVLRGAGIEVRQIFGPKE